MKTGIYDAKEHPGFRDDQNLNLFGLSMSDSNKVNIPELVIVLSLVCAVAAFALAGVYEGTKDKIAEEIRKAELEAVDAVLPRSEKLPVKEIKKVKWKDSEIKVYEAKVDSQLTGTAVAIEEKGFGGIIKVMMGVDPGEKISGVEIVSHKETPGLGAKVEMEEFRKQFTGKSLESKLTIKKDGGEVDQITGASISSKAVTRAIKNGLMFYREKLVPKEN